MKLVFQKKLLTGIEIKDVKSRHKITEFFQNNSLNACDVTNTV